MNKMKQLSTRLPLAVGVFCFLLSTNHLSGQKSKKDSIKNKQIDEVVVTALGIKRDQRKLGYAITKVETKDITQAGVVNPMEALQGKLPGGRNNGRIRRPAVQCKDPDPWKYIIRQQ